MFLPFLLLALIFHFDLFLGPYAILRPNNNFDSEFFNFLIRGQLFLKHGLFSWDPYFAGGMPSFAGQITPYYVLSLFSNFLPSWLIYSLLFSMLTTLAGYGMYRLLAEYLQVARPLAVFGGIVFALTSTFTNVHPMSNFPFPMFFVWFLDLYQPRLGFLSRVCRLLGLLGLALVPYPVLTLPYFPVLQLALVLAYGWRAPNFRALFLGTIAIWTGYVLIYAPTIYALFEYIPFSHRIYLTKYKGFFAALHGAALDLPDGFLIQPGSFLVLWGLLVLRVSGRLRRTLVLFFIILLFTTYFGSPLYSLMGNTLFGKMDLYNLESILPFCSILAGVLVLNAARSVNFSYPRILVSLIICTLAFLIYRPVTSMLVLALGLSLLALMKMPESFKSSPRFPLPWAKLAAVTFAASLAALGMYPKQSYFRNYPPFARNFGHHQELKRLAAERDHEVFRVITVDAHPSVPQSYGLETADQEGALFNKYYKQFFKAVILPQLANPEDAAAFDHHWSFLFLSWRYPWNEPGQDNTFQPSQPKVRSAADWNIPLLLMLNVKYLVADKPIEGMEAFADLYGPSDGEGLPFNFLKRTSLNRAFSYPLWIYRFREPFARGYLAEKPVILSDHQEVLKQLSRQTLADLRQKVFFYAGDIPQSAWSQAPPDNRRAAGETLRLLEYFPDRVVFEGNVSSPSFLVVTNNYDPKWSATVNNQKAPVYRANHAFQAVLLNQAGPFRVVLAYHDPLVWWLHLATLAGLGLFLGCAFIGKQAPSLSPGPLSADPPREVARPDPALTAPLGKDLLLGNFWLMALGGALMALVFVGRSVILKKVPEEGYNKILFFTVVPAVGLLLSLWACWLARLCWRNV